MSNNRNLGNIATAITNATSGQVLTSQGDGVAIFADAAGGSSVTTVTNVSGASDSLTAISSPSVGDIVFVTSTNGLFIRKSNGWFKIADVTNAQPTNLTGVSDSALATDGTATTITLAATDPEGLALTFSAAAKTGSSTTFSAALTDGNTVNALNGSTVIATVAQASNVFTITPNTANNAGTIDITFSVTDGVNAALTSDGQFTLQFNWSVNLSNVTYDNVSFDENEDGSPSAIAFNTNGTKMYILGIIWDYVRQYSLSTGFNLSTASYDNVYFNVHNQEVTPDGLHFNANGTKMYIVGSGSQKVHQYSLSTGFDLSTASYDNVSFSVGNQSPGPETIVFNNNGTKMYIVCRSNDAIYQYSLSTGFNISTASYDNVSLSVSSQDTYPTDLKFDEIGTKMYVLGITNDKIYQYSLSTAFDLSTASYDNVSFSTSSQETDPEGFVFKPDGTKMYIVGRANDRVYQYSTGL